MTPWATKDFDSMDLWLAEQEGESKRAYHIQFHVVTQATISVEAWVSGLMIKTSHSISRCDGRNFRYVLNLTACFRRERFKLCYCAPSAIMHHSTLSFYLSRRAPHKREQKQLSEGVE